MESTENKPPATITALLSDLDKLKKRAEVLTNLSSLKEKKSVETVHLHFANIIEKLNQTRETQINEVDREFNRYKQELGDANRAINSLMHECQALQKMLDAGCLGPEVTESLLEKHKQLAEGVEQQKKVMLQNLHFHVVKRTCWKNFEDALEETTPFYIKSGELNPREISIKLRNAQGNYVINEAVFMEVCFRANDRIKDLLELNIRDETQADLVYQVFSTSVNHQGVMSIIYSCTPSSLGKTTVSMRIYGEHVTGSPLHFRVESAKMANGYVAADLSQAPFTVGVPLPAVFRGVQPTRLAQNGPVRSERVRIPPATGGGDTASVSMQSTTYSNRQDQEISPPSSVPPSVRSLSRNRTPTSWAPSWAVAAASASSARVSGSTSSSTPTADVSPRSAAHRPGNVYTPVPPAPVSMASVSHALQHQHQTVPEPDPYFRSDIITPIETPTDTDEALDMLPRSVPPSVTGISLPEPFECHETETADDIVSQFSTRTYQSAAVRHANRPPTALSEVTDEDREVALIGLTTPAPDRDMPTFDVPSDSAAGQDVVAHEADSTTSNDTLTFSNDKPMLGPLLQAGKNRLVGKLLVQFSGASSDALNRPLGVAQCPLTKVIVVCDNENDMLKSFKADGTPLKMQNRNANGTALERPSAVLFIPSEQEGGEPLVVVKDNSTITLFACKDLEPIATFGNLNRPRGLAIDSQNKLWTLENARRGVFSMVSFDPYSGKEQRRFPYTPPAVSNGGNDANPSFIDILKGGTTDDDIIVVSDLGIGKTGLLGHELRSTGTFTSQAHRLFGFSLKDGRLEGVIGGPGKRLGEFFTPSGVDHSADNYIVAGDAGNERIQVFERSATAVCVIELDRPGCGWVSDIKLTHEGNLIVCCRGKSFIAVYKLQPKTD